MRALLAIALLCGCSSSEDLCTDPQVANLTCFTIHVAGTMDGPGVDELQVDSAYSPNDTSGVKAATHRQSIRVDATQDLGVARLPVDFPMVFASPSDQFTDFESRIVLVARLNGAPVGLGQIFFGDSFSGNTVAPKSHHHFTLDVTKASDSLCFNGMQDASPMETDVDCGGRLCPACGKNKLCMVDTDCVAPLTCQFVGTDPVTMASIDKNFCL